MSAVNVTPQPGSSPALRTLVAGLVDYAGLFPPAALEMAAAVANYAAYRTGPDAWMLGRFVIPVSRLTEWDAAMAALPHESSAAWRGAHLTALITNAKKEGPAISAFNARAPYGVTIDCAEARAATAEDVVAESRAVPHGVTLYCEIPITDDPRSLLQAIAAARVRAKLRTGGITAAVFPSPDDVIRFLQRCVELNVTAKCTAGLHHPIRGEYRLTYDAGADRGMMYGYLNALLAAAALRSGQDAAVAREILLLSDGSQLGVDHDAVMVTLRGNGRAPRTVSLSTTVLAHVRAHDVVAFGSCSFREPVDELAALLSSAAR